VRVNGKIRAREVRVISDEGQQVGILSLHDAIRLAQARGVDLVEVAPTAQPPVCKLMDFGKFRYEQAKREKEARKHQHATKMKEIQLSASIDPHDFGVKLGHAIDFLCDEKKVKISLRFRGREMAHTQYGFQVVKKFIEEAAPYGHPDAEPKLVGRSLNVMISPLPRNKRAKNPRQTEGSSAPAHENSKPLVNVLEVAAAPPPTKPAAAPSKSGGSGFANNPFAKLDVPLSQPPKTGTES
jgi:translation initiation factor IF-3